jgi:hypothetical protein
MQESKEFTAKGVKNNGIRPAVTIPLCFVEKTGYVFKRTCQWSLRVWQAATNAVFRFGAPLTRKKPVPVSHVASCPLGPLSIFSLIPSRRAAMQMVPQYWKCSPSVMAWARLRTLSGKPA